MEQIDSLSPLDGRYHTFTDSLRKYFSESALIKYRTNLEMLYLLHLLCNRSLKLRDPANADANA